MPEISAGHHTRYRREQPQDNYTGGMMSTATKHLPGPWVAVPETNNGWEVRAKVGNHPLSQYVASDTEMAVFIEPWSRFTPEAYKEAMEASFKLAAAAPELLEALRNLTHEAFAAGLSMSHPAMARALDLMNKATGAN